jgi:hypothetical protein
MEVLPEISTSLTYIHSGYFIIIKPFLVFYWASSNYRYLKNVLASG